MERSRRVSDRCWVDLCELSASSGHLCDDHTGALFKALTRVPMLETELAVTIARQDRLQTANEAGRAAVRPLPFSWSGAEAAWNLGNTLATWAGELARALDLPLDQYGHPAELAVEQVPSEARHARSHIVAVPARTIERQVDALDEETGETVPRTIVEIVPARYHDDPAAIVPAAGLAARAAHWLARHLDDLVRLYLVADALDEITHVVGRTRHVIDRAPARWYVGGCDYCGTAMYARPGMAEIVCPNTECLFLPYDGPGGQLVRTTYAVEERRRWMLAAAEDYLATAAEATAALPLLAEVTINVNTLRQAARWRDGRPPEITTDTTHPDGRPRYRLGDVLELARRIALRRAI